MVFIPRPGNVMFTDRDLDVDEIGGNLTWTDIRSSGKVVV